MTASSRTHDRYLGIRPGDLDGKSYATYWNPRMAPLPDDVRDALAHGPVAAPLLPTLADAPREFESNVTSLEIGFALAAEGGMHVALRTAMPQVSPEMIDWWFGWHSDEPHRYKLWHPRAHVHAKWHVAPTANATGRARYVGCTSCVDEYIGSQLGSYLIRFVPPEELGFDSRLLSDPRQATAICARIGFAAAPLDFGHLVHYVTRTEGGAEMRSRFWVGGPYARARRGGPIADLAVTAVKRIMKPTAQDGYGLLVHCSQEMSHLATFLPRLYAELTR